MSKMSAFKAMAHGLTRGMITNAQGGSFKAGFISGLVVQDLV
jgi:hypothetical protein